MKIVSAEEFAGAKAARGSNRKAMVGNSREARKRKQLSQELGSSGKRTSRMNAGHLPPKAEREARNGD